MGKRICSRNECDHILTKTWYDGVLGDYCSQLCLSVHERSDFNNIQHHEIEREKSRVFAEKHWEALGEYMEENAKGREKSALDTQVGGGHYKNYKIQPIDFVHGNNLSYIQGNVIKYIMRYKDKNGVEDLKKVIHYTEMLIDLEYKE